MLLLNTQTVIVRRCSWSFALSDLLSVHSKQTLWNRLIVRIANSCRKNTNCISSDLHIHNEHMVTSSHAVQLNCHDLWPSLMILFIHSFVCLSICLFVPSFLLSCSGSYNYLLIYLFIYFTPNSMYFLNQNRRYHFLYDSCNVQTPVVCCSNVLI